MPFNPKHTDVEPTRAEIDAIKGPLLVEFGAPWCGYCLSAQPMIERLMADFPDVRHIKIYDGKGRPLGRSFQVKLWPTLMFLRDGLVKHRAVRPSEQEILDGLRAISAT